MTVNKTAFLANTSFLGQACLDTGTTDAAMIHPISMGKGVAIMISTVDTVIALSIFSCETIVKFHDC